MKDSQIACDLTRLTREQQRCKEALRKRLAGFVDEKQELEAGYRLRFRSGDQLWTTIGEFVDLERQCCPFLDFSLTLDRRGASSLSMTGPPGTKAFLASQLRPAPPRTTPSRGGRTRTGSKLAIAAGSGVSATMALLCCVPPALFALLGLAGAGLGTVFKSGRPYFVAGALPLLAAGVYLWYRTRSDEVEGTEAWRTGRRWEALLWTAVAASLALLGLSLFL